MKATYTLIFLCFIVQGFAQIPTGYYDSAKGLTGDDLKSALHNTIKGHTEYPYTSSSTDTWDILKETDRDTSNADNVILFYSGWSINAALEYNNAQGWSREHVWAKSHGRFDTDIGVGTDAHNLRPADISVNSARNNKDFDDGGEIYVDGDGTTDCRSDSDSWEARDEVKGDVARILFYMAVRYEGDNGEPDLELVDQVNTFDLNETGKGYHGKLSTLLEWHNNDPVDSFEINRNNVIYTYQGNRNPFVDHPEYVDQIWGDATSTGSIIRSEFRVYPNPVHDHLQVDIPDQKVGQGTIYTLTGYEVLRFDGVGHSTVSMVGLVEGIYAVRVITDDQIYQSKLVVKK